MRYQYIRWIAVMIVGGGALLGGCFLGPQPEPPDVHSDEGGTGQFDDETDGELADDQDAAPAPDDDDGWICDPEYNEGDDGAWRDEDPDDPQLPVVGQGHDERGLPSHRLVRSDFENQAEVLGLEGDAGPEDGDEDGDGSLVDP